MKLHCCNEERGCEANDCDQEDCNDCTCGCSRCDNAPLSEDNGESSQHGEVN